MAISLSIPYLSYAEIGDISYKLLCKYGYHLTVPVPIEELLELNLQINICLIDGLMEGFEIEAWTTSDLATIQMDTYIFKHREQKTRCILAHELGHVVLHKDIFERYKFRTTEEWKIFYTNISDKSYSWLESQAQNYAGLLLVPEMHLEAEFRKLVKENEQKFMEAKRKDIPKDAYEDYFIDFVSTPLAEIFNVTKEKITKRIEKSNLKTLIP